MELDAGDIHKDLDFHVQNPELWWPNGSGAQPLYEIQLALMDGDITLDSRSRRIGLRTIELRQEKDKWGRSFAFVINGSPIFCKGANWVPADQFPARVTREQYRDLISSAAIANMNMFRVWGGGIYEDDTFYDLCDEYGILVWQDFMFACAHYPVDSDMLENIGIEASENVRRIRDHACLALWCGNNEMEWFVADIWDKKDERKRRYSELFHGLLRGVCAEEDPDTTYWASSPASDTPFTDPNSENEGDGHYWDVWHGKKPFSDYRKHYYRFMSEFGFQSLPSIDTIRSFAWPTEWNLTSYIMESHQKNPAGNELILYYMAKTFRIPNGFPMMVYVSQVLQAEAMRYGVEHWRRNRNDNRCMGTLYWQYNDCWPAASWSGIDYNHRWKALHYYAKRFYAPVLLSAATSSNRVQLHITNDTSETFTGKIRWSLEKLNGVKLRDGEADVEVAPLADTCVRELDLTKKLGKTDPREVVLVYGLWNGEKRVSLGIVGIRSGQTPRVA